MAEKENNNAHTVFSVPNYLSESNIVSNSSAENLETKIDRILDDIQGMKEQIEEIQEVVFPTEGGKRRLRKTKRSKKSKKSKKSRRNHK
jgi:hypothetical protein